jgi:hypothetical protein
VKAEALLNKGISLAKLGQPREGLRLLLDAKALLVKLQQDPPPLGLVENPALLDQMSRCDDATRDAQEIMATRSQSGTRSWWQFWK